MKQYISAWGFLWFAGMLEEIYGLLAHDVEVMGFLVIRSRIIENLTLELILNSLYEE